MLQCVLTFVSVVDCGLDSEACCLWQIAMIQLEQKVSVKTLSLSLVLSYYLNSHDLFHILFELELSILRT